MSGTPRGTATVPRWRTWLAVTALMLAIGFLESIYHYLDTVIAGGHPSYVAKLIEEMTAFIGILVFIPAMAWWARRARRVTRSWGTRLLLLAAALPVVWLAHTTWMALTRAAIFPLAGLGRYDYGDLWLRYPMEATMQTIGYAIIVGTIYALDDFRDGQARAARLATIEKELADARLAALRAQLHPHFLFNALNTVSSVMYEDVAAADRMLAGLGELLRHAIDASDTAEVPLRDEVALLERYLDIVRTRFADRLTVDVDVPAELGRAIVPQLALQPLVENALEHGAPADGSAGWVVIAARRVDGRLRLEVRDNGPGLRVPPEQALGAGVGLSNTATRLATLYGAEQRVELARAPEGGCLVALELPYREAAAS